MNGSMESVGQHFLIQHILGLIRVFPSLIFMAYPQHMPQVSDRCRSCFISVTVVPLPLSQPPGQMERSTHINGSLCSRLSEYSRVSVLGCTQNESMLSHLSIHCGRCMIKDRGKGTPVLEISVGPTCGIHINQIFMAYPMDILFSSLL